MVDKALDLDFANQLFQAAGIQCLSVDGLYGVNRSISMAPK